MLTKGFAENTQADTERAVRAACDRGNDRHAATLVIERYGPEILGFLFSFVADHGSADDVFSMFCEDVWRGLPGFQWRCTVRGWCYRLARHAALRFLRTGPARAARHLPLSQASEVWRLANRARTGSCPAHARTEVKSRMRRLREKLAAEEQLLLVLHVDKDLPWTEVAMILAPEGDSLSAGALARQSARVRKRFQLVKEKLKRMARSEGLL